MTRPAAPRTFFVAVGLVLGFLALLSRYAGVPALGRGYFALGVVSLVASVGGFAYLAWLLLIRPLPQGGARPVSAAYGRVLAALLAVSGVALIVGGFWDEVWHRRYGLPFGEDLLWRPHQLIYLSLLIVIGLALFAALRLWRAPGPLAARFKREPLLGLLALLGGLFLYVLPADPLWHLVYGADISAWSLPHLLLALSYSLAMLLAAAFALSATPRSPWRGLWRARSGELLALVVLSFMLLFTLQVLVTEWDTGFSFILENRPEWMLSSLLVGMAAFVGTLALRATRLVGAATAVGLLAVALRWAMLEGFAAPGMSARPWLCALPPLIALDLWHALRLRQGRAMPGWVSGGLAAALGMIVLGLPLVGWLFSYPQIHAGNLAGMLVSAVLAALPAAWLGAVTGDALWGTSAQASPGVPHRLAWLPSAALIGMLGVIVLMVGTARAPI